MYCPKLTEAVKYTAVNLATEIDWSDKFSSSKQDSLVAAEENYVECRSQLATHDAASRKPTQDCLRDPKSTEVPAQVFQFVNNCKGHQDAQAFQKSWYKSNHETRKQ